MFVTEMLANRRRGVSMFVHALMEVPSCKANITCIAQVTFELVNKGLLVYKQRFGFHQRVDEHRHTSSSIGKHFLGKHSSTPKDLTSNFTISKKCNSKFDCLIYEMFFINELRPSLNVQCDSICAKVFK